MRIVRIVRSRVFKVTKLKQVQLSAAEPAFFKMLMGLSGQAEKLLFSALRKRCHCEERSDVAIPRFFREVRKTGVPSTVAV